MVSNHSRPSGGMRGAWLAALLGAAALLAPTLLSAAPAQVSEPRTRLVLLGTAAGPVSKALRSQPANALVIDGRVYLIDVGNGVLNQLARAHLKLADLDAIFITHNHIDHNADLGAVFAFGWVAGRTAPLPVVGPPGTKAVAQAAIESFAHSEEIFQSEVPNRPLPTLGREVLVTEGQPGVVYQDKLLTVIAVENSHYKRLIPGSPAFGRDRSYSYKFQTPDKTIVFTGDTGESDALEKLSKNADILVSEVLDVARVTKYVNDRAAREGWSEALRTATLGHHLEGHLAAESLGRMATRAGVKTVVLTHYTPTDPDSLDVSDFVAGVRKTYSGVIIAGEDLSAF